jgi:hypothetical protein
MPEENITPYDYDNMSSSRPELSMKPVDKRPAIIGIVVALVILVGFGLLGWWLFVNPVEAAVLRDIFIIFMGLGVFFIILLLIALIVATGYLVLKVNDLVQLINREVVQLLNQEIRPALTRVQSTLITVKGTTTFLSDQAVKPVMTTAGYVAAVKAIFRSLFRRR